MPISTNFGEHPTPARVYELACDYTNLLRLLYTHPEFKFHEPPTAVSCNIDPSNTHQGLYMVTDFVQNSYIDFILPLLPEGSPGQCKSFANAWAAADPDRSWHFTWDEEEEALKDTQGNSAAFPRIPEELVPPTLMQLFTRGMVAKKMILDNETDLGSRLLMGGQPLDFGEGVKEAARKL